MVTTKLTLYQGQIMFWDEKYSEMNRCSMDLISKFDCKINQIAKENTNMTYDEHYKKEAIQAVDLMEHVIQREQIPIKPRSCLYMALKYVWRAGTKEGEPWEKDLAKAQNWLHRAQTGKWINEQ